MSLLPVIPVVLLVLVAVWFFWPIIADPIARAAARRDMGEADQVAEHLFETWNEHCRASGVLAQTGRS